MTKFRKAFSILLTAIMVFTLIPVTAFADGIGVELSDPAIVITTTIDDEPDEEPVESSGFNVKVDNWRGSGTEDDPFTIHNRVGFENLVMLSREGYTFSGIYFALENDISMKEYVINEAYSTVGSEATPFAGVFDGRGYTITDYNKRDDDNRVGLFKVLTGTIKNLNVSGSVNTKSTAYIGGIVGRNYGTIRNCTFSGTVSGTANDTYAGGIAGHNEGKIYYCTNYAQVDNLCGKYTGGVAGQSMFGTVKNCSNEGEVIGKNSVGGIVGYTKRVISGCSNTGEITGKTHVGGIAGELGSDISDCKNSGKLFGVTNLGGIVGTVYAGDIDHCTNSGELDGGTGDTFSNWGGIVGNFSCYAHTIRNCSNSGVLFSDEHRVYCADNFGGIAGTFQVSFSVDEANYNVISSCYNIGEIFGVVDGGGIVGDCRYGKILNCLNAGGIYVAPRSIGAAADSGGGICGFTDYAVIEECSNTGYVYAKKYAGGITGYSKYSKLANCYNAASVHASDVSGGISGRFDNSSLVKSISIGYIDAPRDQNNLQTFLQTLIGESGANWQPDPDPKLGAIFGRRTNDTDDPDVYLALSRNYYYEFENTYKYSEFGIDYEYSCPAEPIGSGNASSCSESQIRGLTEYEYRYRPDEDIYITWDFQNVWHMTDNGPRLRHVGIAPQDDVYHIETVDDLIGLRDVVNAGSTLKNVTVKLENDLDISGVGKWDPIGGEAYTSVALFSGVFDGGNHTVSGVQINSTDEIMGFFGNVDGTVKNLKVHGEMYTGAIGGGIAAYLLGGTIEKCAFTGFIQGRSYIGGIVGFMKQSAQVRGCTCTASVYGSGKYVGGIAGQAHEKCLIEKCTFESNKVEGDGYLGGIVGHLSYSTVQNCYHDGDVVGDEHNSSGERVGGIAGSKDDNSKIINSCHYTGTVSGCEYVGGVVGYLQKNYISSWNENNFQLYNCYYLTGTVKKTDFTGAVDTTDRAYGKKSSDSGIAYNFNPDNIAEWLTVPQFRIWGNFHEWDNDIWTVKETEDHPVLRCNYEVVTFDANDGSGTMNRFFVPPFGGELPACGFSRSGYTFLGWNTKPDSTGTSYKNKEFVDDIGTITLYAVWGVKQNVNYVDVSGNTKTANNSIGLHDKLVALNSGWYFVDGSVTYSKRIEINGNVNIILKDGCALTDNYGIHVPSDSSLTIWGQEGRYQVPDADFTTQGTGRLSVEFKLTDTKNPYSAIGGNVGETPGEIKINGGVITAFAQKGAAIGGAQGESGSFVAFNNCCVTATGYAGAAAIGGGFNGDGGTVSIKRSYISAEGGLAVYTVNTIGKTFSSPAIGAGAPQVADDGSCDQLNGVNIAVEDSYVRAQAGSLEGSVTSGDTDARAIGTSLLNDYDLSWISSLKNVKCVVEGVAVEYERRAYFCTKHSVDLVPCTVHVGSHDDIRKCRYCGADFNQTAAVVVCDYNFDKSPKPFSYASDGTISFTVSADNITTPEDAYFKGWNTEKDGSGVMYVPGNTVTIDGKVNLYAQWGGKIPVVYMDEDGSVQTASAIALTADDTVLNSGWYVAEGELFIRPRITINGDVKLILADDCNMTAKNGINVCEGNSFTVYGQIELYNVPDESVQTFGTGSLYAEYGSNHDAAIGSNYKEKSGDITINGGVITAAGRFSAGIGAGDVGTCGTVTINNGYVNAYGARGSAGIGGGGYTSGGIVNISGGFVKATGSVYEDTGQAAPGIGSGRPKANGSQPLSPGTVNITGGTVIATAGTAPEDGTGAMAIGVNFADEAQVTEDSLTIGDHMRVTAGDSLDASELSLYADRVAACRGQYARIEVCKEHAVTEDDNTHCAYCGKELPVDAEILGDVDGDGEATVIDATYIQRYGVHMKIPVSEDELLRRGDVDGDGEVTVIDATFIQRFEVKIQTPYPIGEPIS